MTAYRDYIVDLPGRCIDILEHFESDAKTQDREVTLLLMAASSAFLIPRERTQSRHPDSDSAFFEEELLGFKKEELNTTWSKSLLFRDTGEWLSGFTKHFGNGPSSWESPTISVRKKDVSEVLAIIRNALAHGNLFTDGNPSTGDPPIQSLRLYSEKRKKKKCETCEQPVGPVSGYKYLDIPVNGFRQFLLNWYNLLAMYWIAGPWPGRLAIVPRPRGGDWLEEEVCSWQKAGLEVVVSLLTHDENTELELNQESLLCQAQGIQFHAYPIPDRGVPASRKATADLVQKLEKALEAGKSVAVHCRQGIGRSSLIAALLLVSAGIDPEAALAQIRQARGCEVPDTIEQSNWIKSFAVVPVLQ